MEAVLIVGDQATGQPTVPALLMRHGFDVRTVPSADDAVRECRGHPPDLVLAPAGLTCTNGEPLTRALRSDAAMAGELGMLCLAASTEQAELEIRDGAADTVLLRPVSARTLMQELTLIADRRPRRHSP